MINFLKKISFLTYLVWVLVLFSVSATYYADYQNKKWGEDIDFIHSKYAPEISDLRKKIPRGELVFSGELIKFYLISQGEIDAVKPSYTGSLSIHSLSRLPSIKMGALHKNSYKNDIIGIGPRICYSSVVNEYPRTNAYKYEDGKKKMLPEVQDYIFRINEHCKTQNIGEYTKRSEIIYQLQSLRSIYELNGKEVDEYVKIYNATLFGWKVKILDILDRNFFQKNEISKIVVDGFILTIIIESIVATIRFFRKRKLSKG